jgi:hypothetical protein
LSQGAVAPGAEDTWSAGARLVAVSAAIAILAIAVPVGILFEVPDSGRSQAWPITLLIAVWGGVRLSVLWTKGEAKLFDFFFWLYTYLFMGVAATVQLRANDIPYTTPGMSASLDLPTAWVVLLGVACYEVSRAIWLLARRRSAPRELQPAAISPGRTVLLYLVGLALSAYYVSKVGLRLAIANRYAADTMLSQIWPEPSTRAIFTAVAVYPILVAVGAVIQVRRAAPAGDPVRVVLWLMAAAGIAVLGVVASPVSSARYTFGTVAFAILVYLGVTRTRLRTRIATGGMIGAMLFVFPVLDIFRGGSIDLSRKGSFFAEYSGNPDYDSFWQIANALSYSVSDSMQPFRQILGSMLFWVPRVLWPDKPTDTGVMLANYRGYSFGNLSAPIWSEFLVNAGVIAVGVGFVFLGVALTSLDRQMAPAHAKGGWRGLVGAILPVYMMILMRGSLLQATGALVVASACLWWVRKAVPRGNELRAGPRSPSS